MPTGAELSVNVTRSRKNRPPRPSNAAPANIPAATNSIRRARPDTAAACARFRTVRAIPCKTARTARPRRQKSWGTLNKPGRAPLATALPLSCPTTNASVPTPLNPAARLSSPRRQGGGRLRFVHDLYTNRRATYLLTPNRLMANKAAAATAWPVTSGAAVQSIRTPLRPRLRVGSSARRGRQP